MALEINQTELEALRRELNAQQLRRFFVLSIIMLLALLAVGILAIAYIPSDALMKIQDGATIKPSESDYIKWLLSVIAIGFGAVIGFLGLKRLQHFDGEIDSLRKQIYSQIKDERIFSKDERNSFYNSMAHRLDEFEGIIEALSLKTVYEAVGEKEAALKNLMEEHSKTSSSLLEELKTELSPFDWLGEEKRQAIEFSKRYLIDESEISIGRLHEIVSSSTRGSDSYGVAVKLTLRAVEGNAVGDAIDFHNLAAEFARNDSYSIAARIVERGLKIHSKDVDLIADAIKYFSGYGEIAKASEYSKSLFSIKKENWNWRCFVFLGDYYEQIGSYEQANQLYEEYKKWQPYDERAYSQQGGILYRTGRYKEAIEVFSQGLRSCPRAAQTSLYLARSYIQIGEYKNAVSTLSRALESTADSQPSINISSIFWTRAEAKDSLAHSIHSKVDLDSKSIVDFVSLINSCIADYELSSNMVDSLSVYKMRSIQRITILKSLARSVGVDDDLIVSSKPGEGEEAVSQLMSLLNNIHNEQSDSDG